MQSVVGRQVMNSPKRVTSISMKSSSFDLQKDETEKK